MSQIINQTGALRYLLSELRAHRITQFKSLSDIALFQQNHAIEKENYKRKMVKDLQQEIASDQLKIAGYESELDRYTEARNSALASKINYIDSYLKKTEVGNGLFRVLQFLRRNYLELKRNRIVEDGKRLSFFQLNLQTKIQRLVEMSRQKVADFDKLIEAKTKTFNDEIERILRVIDQLSPLLIGAKGESEAITALSELNDDYVVINDFRQDFTSPIYDKKNDDRIYSIQVDHLVIGPTGVFAVETKKWSRLSIENRDLFSPVKQLKRAGHALFCYLNRMIDEAHDGLEPFWSGWGARKLSVNQILLMVNASTKQEFQYVRVANLNNIIRQITAREKVLTRAEVTALRDQLTEYSPPKFGSNRMQ